MKMLPAALEQLAGAPMEERATIMRDIATRLDALREEQAEELIMAELASGKDAATGLAFVPGEAELESAPSWRVFLLDRLGKLNPRLAADYARQNVFPASDSAEEWAISLRNVLHSYPPAAAGKGRSEISDLLTRMFQRAGWREGSGEGLLEAMDFAAHSSDPAAQIAAFASWTEKSGKPENAAAVQIALERAVAVRGGDVVPALAKATPSLQAAALARADLRSTAQAQAVASFLRGQAANSDQAAVFFRAFPLHRFSVAPGLAGIPRAPDAAQLRAADEAALNIVTVWAADPTLAAHRDDLRGLQEKLRELTGRE